MFVNNVSLGVYAEAFSAGYPTEDAEVARHGARRVGPKATVSTCTGPGGGHEHRAGAGVLVSTNIPARPSSVGTRPRIARPARRDGLGVHPP